jgi:hypothetical protein
MKITAKVIVPPPTESQIELTIVLPISMANKLLSDCKKQTYASTNFSHYSVLADVLHDAIARGE